MVEEFVSPSEFERALSDIKDSLENLRTEIKDIKDKLEERRDADLINRVETARAEGILEGRVQALEGRLDRQENWRLATIAPGLVALGVIIFEWFKGGK